MSVKIKHEVKITSPMTLGELADFVSTAQAIGVPASKRLMVSVYKSDPFDQRESDYATLTAEA